MLNCWLWQEVSEPPQDWVLKMTTFWPYLSCSVHVHISSISSQESFWALLTGRQTTGNRRRGLGPVPCALPQFDRRHMQLRFRRRDGCLEGQRFWTQGSQGSQTLTDSEVRHRYPQLSTINTNINKTYKPDQARLLMTHATSCILPNITYTIIYVDHIKII